jgi:hypothetical protein
LTLLGGNGSKGISVTKLALGDTQYISRRSSHLGWLGGPYAFLIREVIGEASAEPYHYVEASETVADICTAFQARTSKDLLAKFSLVTEPVIVKFRHASQFGTELLDAANYAYRKAVEIDRHMTPCFSGGGIPIPRTDILSIEAVGNRNS